MANCVLVWFGVGPRLRSLVVFAVGFWRNAYLAGGFAGRLVSWFLFAFLVVDFFFALILLYGWNHYVSVDAFQFVLSAYTNYRTEP